MADLFDLVDGRRGHFLLESGLHSELWLDLDPLFADQRRIAPFVTTLSSKLRAYEVEAVCGALVGGAFLAQLLAQELEVEFCYTEKKSRSLPSVGTTSGLWALPSPNVSSRAERGTCFSKYASALETIAIIRS